MSKRFNFTIAAINNIKLPEKGRVEYRDTKVPELTLRVTANGSMSFSVAKKIGSKYVRVTLGKFPANTIEQARKKARENLLLLENGINPTEKKRTERIKQLSVADPYQQYEDNFKARIKVGERRQKSLDDFSRTWKLHVKPRIAKYRAKEVSHAIALKVTDDIKANLTAGLFNASIALLRAMFKFAVSHELVISNPFSSISKVRIESRTRFLSREEIAKLFDSLKEEKQIYQDVVQILIYTGQRKGNVYSMEWSELDLERGVWTIPHSKTKTKTVYHAQLATPAVEILKRRQIEHESLFGDSPFVFATRQRANQKGHLSTKSDNSGYWKRIIERAGLYSEDTSTRITPHTMRKTLASWQALEGVDLLSISKSLGHSDISTTAKAYAHLSGDTVKAGVQKATDALQKAANLTNGINYQVKLIKLVKTLTEDQCKATIEHLNNQNI
ncbi:site-specific integrase [Thalassotalea sp. G2M2-11]|uniref:tyrosine-type recombinase/integrase n=1 Tax=Thalassotalea sp. G2M2-11 TaxID=2787627 RepID=UPI0019CF82D8|nr:site-specific integrase [Thalassotalea sp. G2M2-11]